MAIYTKLGDKGETSLFDPTGAGVIRISKSSRKIAAIGAVDEVNSFIGIILAQGPPRNVEKVLLEIQKDLFTMGAILAGAKLRFPKTKASKLEKRIDELEGKLPVIKNFILPGGSVSGSQLHFARSLVRRAERALVALNRKEKIKPQILSFMNRLSDYLFMLAREVNFREGEKEKFWRRGQRRLKVR